MDRNDPTKVCNKKLKLCQGSTSTLRNHIKGKHVRDWTKILDLEKEKSDKDAAQKEELRDAYAEREGTLSEEEQELGLATPGRKRPAPGEADLFDTPKSKRNKPNQGTPIAARSIFHRPPKHNVKDKKQLYFDLRLTEKVILNGYSYASLGTDASKRWYEEFLPQYHLKHPTTYSR